MWWNSLLMCQGHRHSTQVLEVEVEEVVEEHRLRRTVVEGNWMLALTMCGIEFRAARAVLRWAAVEKGAFGECRDLHRPVLKVL
jgi:hypothetical protein